MGEIVSVSLNDTTKSWEITIKKKRMAKYIIDDLVLGYMCMLCKHGACMNNACTVYSHMEYVYSYGS